MWLRTNDRERGRDKEKCVGWFSVGIGTKKRKRLVHQFAPLSLPLFHPSPSICLPMVVAQRKNVKSVVRWPPRRLSVVWVHHHQSQFLFKFYRGFFVGHDDAALQSQRLIRKSDFSIWKLKKAYVLISNHQIYWMDIRSQIRTQAVNEIDCEKEVCRVKKERGKWRDILMWSFKEKIEVKLMFFGRLPRATFYNNDDVILAAELFPADLSDLLISDWLPIQGIGRGFRILPRRP